MLDKIFGTVKDETLVDKALTHPSFTKEFNLNDLLSYERLEFFGDSVLKLFTSKILYNTYSEYPEGDLSKIRSILVSDAILSKIAPLKFREYELATREAKYPHEIELAKLPNAHSSIIPPFFHTSLIPTLPPDTAVVNFDV